METHQIFGYIRVSTKEQNTDRQLDALAPLEISKRNLYMDKQSESGKDFDRPVHTPKWKRGRPIRLWI